MAGEFITEAEAMDSGMIYDAVAIAQTILYTSVTIIFFIWIYRTHKNLYFLNAGDLRFTPGWSVGWFFVPFMNLFRPYQVVVETWKASDPNTNVSDKQSWKTLRSSPIIAGWWVFYLISNYAGFILLRMSWQIGEELSDLLYITEAYIYADFINIVWMITSILLIRRISQFQDVKYRILTLPTTADTVKEAVKEPEISYCSQCGDKVTERMDYCPNCGNRIRE